jgi:colanic acid biosynthesis glycosyl transferase WcaI
MKMLFYGINYAPELTGIGKYTAEMAEYYAKDNKVDVITSFPYYPAWKVQAPYKNIFWKVEKNRNVRIMRCPMYIPKKVTGSKRMVHEFTFLMSSIVFWIKQLFTSYDVVFTPYPPLIIGLYPFLYKIVHPKTKWVFHIQDLQVDAAKDLGMIKNERLLNVLVRIEKFWIRKADVVSSISEGMKRKILNKGVDIKKYLMLPNWCDVNEIQVLSKNESLRKELGLTETEKVILYSGNIGEKQGVEQLIDVSIHLPTATVLIAGEGANKNSLIQYAKNKGAKNCRFIGLQPYEKLAAFIATADVHIVLQKKSAADLVLPSKLMTLMSAGALTVVTADEGSSLHTLCSENNIALICPSEDTEKLISTIRIALENDYSSIKKNARRFAEEKLDKKAILDRFLSELQAS